MWYKEWLAARYKFMQAVTVYLLAGIALWVSEVHDLYFQVPSPLLIVWLKYGVIATCILAALAGMDVFSEEKDKGTLSFLLARPVSRVKVYRAKILMSIGSWAPLFLLNGVVMLVLDQIPRNVTLETGFSGPSGRPEFTISHIIVPSSRPEEGIILIFVVLLLGISITCLSGLISIFTRNFIQGFTFTALALFGFFMGLYYASQQTLSISYLTLSHGKYEIIFPLLFVSTVGFLGVGLIAFQRKEF